MHHPQQQRRQRESLPHQHPKGGWVGRWACIHASTHAANISAASSATDTAATAAVAVPTAPTRATWFRACCRWLTRALTAWGVGFVGSGVRVTRSLSGERGSPQGASPAGAASRPWSDASPATEAAPRRAVGVEASRTVRGFRRPSCRDTKARQGHEDRGGRQAGSRRAGCPRSPRAVCRQDGGNSRGQGGMRDRQASLKAEIPFVLQI